MPEGPGADLLLRELALDWGALGFKVERAQPPRRGRLRADRRGRAVDLAGVVRPPLPLRRGARVRPDADKLLEAARTAPVPAQRYALLAQAAARIDDDQLFIPITAPIRWSLVSKRIQGFAGNRYARHTLTDLEQKPGSGD